jgi:dipeptide/tripeptide permease
MELHGLPNDILPNIDPIVIILFIPLFDRLIYPFIRGTLHLAFTQITRITLGFFIASLAMVYAAVLQSKIYSTGPCYTSPSNCPAGKLGPDKYAPNKIHVAWQAPAYVLVALSEILASVTGLELAYAKAPENMKSFIMSLFLLTSAFGSALGIFLAPVAKDPRLVWLYTGLAGTAAIAGVVFHWMFKGLDGKDVARPVEIAEEEIEMISRESDEEEESNSSSSVRDV